MVFKGKMNAGTRAYVRFTVKDANTTQWTRSGIENFLGASLCRILKNAQRGQSDKAGTKASVVRFKYSHYCRCEFPWSWEIISGSVCMHVSNFPIKFSSANIKTRKFWEKKRILCLGEKKSKIMGYLLWLDGWYLGLGVLNCTRNLPSWKLKTPGNETSHRRIKSVLWQKKPFLPEDVSYQTDATPDIAVTKTYIEFFFKSEIFKLEGI